MAMGSSVEALCPQPDRYPLVLGKKVRNHNLIPFRPGLEMHQRVPSDLHPEKEAEVLVIAV